MRITRPPPPKAHVLNMPLLASFIEASLVDVRHVMKLSISTRGD